MVKGLQGDDPKYWLTASLMKHFLANSNEDGRGGSSSDFDARLLREYYSVPFRMGVDRRRRRAPTWRPTTPGTSIPMTVNPIIRDITMKEWGVDGIICTDAGSLRNMVTEAQVLPDHAKEPRRRVKAGINQFLDDHDYRTAVTGRDGGQGLLTEADIDAVHQGRVPRS